MTSNFECQIVIQSFGFLHEVPEAPAGALLIDLRSALRNPADDPALIEMTGLDDPVISHVLETPGAMMVIERTVEQTKALYEANCRRNLMARVLVGCQGGRHRSVVIAASVCQVLTSHGYKAEVEHLHVDRPVVRK